MDTRPVLPRAVRLPGRVDRVLQDGNYPADEPERWARYKAARTTRRCGSSGHSAVVHLVPEDWLDIADYILSNVECWEDMTSEELGTVGQSELRAARLALQRINAACSDLGGGRTDAVSDQD